MYNLDLKENTSTWEMENDYMTYLCHICIEMNIEVRDIKRILSEANIKISDENLDIYTFTKISNEKYCGISNFNGGNY